MTKPAVRPRSKACARIFCLRSLMAPGVLFSNPLASMDTITLFLLNSRRGRGVGVMAVGVGVGVGVAVAVGVGVGVGVGMGCGFTPTVLAARKMTTRASNRSAKSHPLSNTVSRIRKRRSGRRIKKPSSIYQNVPTCGLL